MLQFSKIVIFLKECKKKGYNSAKGAKYIRLNQTKLATFLSDLYVLRHKHIYNRNYSLYSYLFFLHLQSCKRI